jgi:hypothetical protein
MHRPAHSGFLFALTLAVAGLTSGAMYGQPPGPPGPSGPPGGRRFPQSNTSNTANGFNPGQQPPANAGQMVNQGTCSKCKKQVTWTGSPPHACPHCGTKFSYVNNADGSRTNLKTGRTTRTNYAAIGLILLLLFVVLAGWGVYALVKANAKPKRRRKKVRRRIDDEEPRSRRRRRDDDDDDY